MILKKRFFGDDSVFGSLNFQKLFTAVFCIVCCDAGVSPDAKFSVIMRRVLAPDS